MILIHIIAVLIFLSYVWNSLHNKIFKVSPILHLPQDFEILHLPKLSLPLVSSERAGSQWGRGKIQVISSLPWRTQVLPQTIQGATECSRAIRQAGRTETSTVRVFHHLLLLLPIRAQLSHWVKKKGKKSSDALSYWSYIQPTARPLLKECFFTEWIILCTF